MFDCCSWVTSLNLSNFNTAKVTNMDGMFKSCSGLATIYAGDGWNTDKVTSSDYMFISCAKLKGAISYDSSKTDVTYANWTTGYLTYKALPATLAAGSSWYKSSQNRNTITKITFMDSYTPASYDEKWAADVNGTGDITCYRTGTEIINAGNGAGKIKANADSNYLFSARGYDCFTELTSIENLALVDTSNVTNMNWMFDNCSGLTTIYAGDAWNTDKVTSSSRMFTGCTVLQGDIAYNSKYVDKTYAKTSGGYLTYKAASTKTLSLNIDPNSGAVTSYDVSTNPISRFRAFLDWSDTANVA